MRERERERGDNIMSDADKVAITNGWLLPRSPHKKILPFSSSSSSSYEQHYIHNHSWVAERIPWSDGRLLPRNRSFLASARSSQTLPQWRCRSHHQISPSAHRGSEFHVPCGRPRPKDQCVSFPVLLSVRLTPLICQGTIRCKTEEQGANRGRMSRRDVVKLAGTALGVVRSVSFLSSSRDGLLDSPLSLASGNPSAHQPRFAIGCRNAMPHSTECNFAIWLLTILYRERNWTPVWGNRTAAVYRQWSISMKIQYLNFFFWLNI